MHLYMHVHLITCTHFFNGCMLHGITQATSSDKRQNDQMILHVHDLFGFSANGFVNH